MSFVPFWSHSFRQFRSHSFPGTLSAESQATTTYYVSLAVWSQASSWRAGCPLQSSCALWHSHHSISEVLEIHAPYNSTVKLSKLFIQASHGESFAHNLLETTLYDCIKICSHSLTASSSHMRIYWTLTTRKWVKGAMHSVPLTLKTYDPFPVDMLGLCSEHTPLTISSGKCIKMQSLLRSEW